MLVQTTSRSYDTLDQDWVRILDKTMIHQQHTADNQVMWVRISFHQVTSIILPSLNRDLMSHLMEHQFNLNGIIHHSWLWICHMRGSRYYFTRYVHFSVCYLNILYLCCMYTLVFKYSLAIPKHCIPNYVIILCGDINCLGCAFYGKVGSLVPSWFGVTYIIGQK